MAEVTKYQLINNNNNNNGIVSDLKTHFSLFRTRKSTSFIYGVVLIFVLFTVFLAFSPSTSSTSSSPWFTNLFTVNSTSPPHNYNESDRSHFSSVYSYFFPNSTAQSQSSEFYPTRSHDNATFQVPISQNLNDTQHSHEKDGVLGQNNSTDMQDQTQIPVNTTVDQSSIHHVSPPPEISPAPEDKRSSEVEVSPPPTVQQQQEEEKKSNQTSSEVEVSPPPQIPAVPQQQQNNQSSSSEVEVSPPPQIPPVQQQQNNHSSSEVEVSPPQNQDSKDNPQISQTPASLSKNASGVEVKSSDLAASLSKNQEGSTSSHANDSVSGGVTKKQGNGDGVVENLVGCDLYDGGWIRDESYPLYKPGSCKLVDEQFNCYLNGRPDNDYQKLKWKPKACSLPRLKPKNMLELLRGKRLVYVGDSLNRNMWESLVCILKSFVKNKKKVYEAYGHHNLRTEASYSFVFKDYNCTVEFFVAPFLVQQWEVTDKNGTTKETLRLDLMVSDAHQYKNADYIVFNTGHWWTHDKTSKGEDYYQEGSHVYKELAVTEAYRRAITTWARWVDANIDPQKTHVMFRGYSASHFSGGQWNSGGQCDSETEPIRNETYLTRYPWKAKVFEKVVKGMKVPVSYLNVTRLTDYRKDGHPSVFRKQHLSVDEKKSPLRYQDCSHWCLPGVPDSWNELLYAELLRKQYVDQQQKNKT